ncbi:hypothetical protein LINPERHAP2_LOCUS2839, partial [Linum perenne]
MLGDSSVPNLFSFCIFAPETFLCGNLVPKLFNCASLVLQLMVGDSSVPNFFPFVSLPLKLFPCDRLVTQLPYIHLIKGY